MLQGDGLCHIFLLSDGLNVNGSEIVKGINSALSDEVTCTGGLAGERCPVGARAESCAYPVVQRRARDVHAGRPLDRLEVIDVR
jgi:hypothetical protein